MKDLGYTRVGIEIERQFISQKRLEEYNMMNSVTNGLKLTAETGVPLQSATEGKLI